VTAKAIMFMGTGSDVGKSLIVAGLARAYAKRGLKVAPFKPQNMSNNAAVAVDGGEIGRAQHLQARAAGVRPTVHMNPVLLKPESDTGAQVVVQGRRVATLTAREYFARRLDFLPAILASFHGLASAHDLVLVEGAGSPAETNLRAGDLANFGFALAAGVPSVLVGDIHRGGVIASIVGTHAVLDNIDRALMKAFLINKFHGDPALFDEGRSEIERRCAMPCLGVVPHFAGAVHLPAEDAVSLDTLKPNTTHGLQIAVLRLPRIANFDDLDPLRAEANVSVAFVQPGAAIAGNADLVIIPGSKSTVADLAALRHHGWDIDVAAHVRRGGHVLGLCGGYQMLGRTIHDPHALEGKAGSVPGLGLLDVETTLLPDKTVTETTGQHVASGTTIRAYEIHLGRTTGPDCARPFARTTRGLDGAVSGNGRVTGTYLHGCFVSDSFRRSFLHGLGVKSTTTGYDQLVERTLDDLAAHLETHVNLDLILELAKTPKT
jgi:adenosylcobyric acid synthase